MTAQNIQVSNARGESFADVARRVGSIAGTAVAADDTDAEVLDKLVAVGEDAADRAEAAVATVAPVTLPPNEDGVRLLVAQRVVGGYLGVVAKYMNGDPYPEGSDADPVPIYPDDPRLAYRGYTRVATFGPEQVVLARPANGTGDAQQYDMPSGEQVFRTEAESLSVELFVKGTVEGVTASAANPPFVAEVLVNGTDSFTASTSNTDTGDTRLVINASGLGPGLKTFQVFPPIERPGGHGRIYLPRGAGLAGAVPPPDKLLLIRGDSNGAGQGTSKPSKTWARQVQKARGCRLINNSYPGRQTHAGDGAVDAALDPDAIIINIGTNDFIVGAQAQNRSLAAAMADFQGIVTGALGSTATAILVISPIRNATETPDPGWSRQDWSLPDLRSAQQAFVSAQAGYGTRLRFLDGYAILGHAPTVDGTHMGDADHALFFAAVNAALPSF